MFGAPNLSRFLWCSLCKWYVSNSNRRAKREINIHLTASFLVLLYLVCYVFSALSNSVGCCNAPKLWKTKTEIVNGAFLWVTIENREKLAVVIRLYLLISFRASTVPTGLKFTHLLNSIESTVLAFSSRYRYIYLRAKVSSWANRVTMQNFQLHGSDRQGGARTYNVKLGM